jgi:endonuclease/exonuclease/phosphatase family metal-dependent hydrolase
MRILTYNIHGCVGSDRRDVPERVLRVIQEVDADVVALQEVDDDREGRLFISELRKMNYASMVYSPTMTKPTGHYGNLLMTRKKSERIEQHLISVKGFEPRGVIAATTSGVVGRVRIVATHLGLKMSERRWQWRQLFDLCQPVDGEKTAVLMGDFNEWLPFGSNLRRAERAALNTSRLRTFPVRWPIFALDRIFVFGSASQVEFFVPRVTGFREASDHLPLVADLQ